jgi:SAM-dependent methyltransferase
METNRQAHWERVFTEKAPDAVSWYQPNPLPSLELIHEAAGELGFPCRLIDIGAGDSRLADALIDDPRFELTALDISAPALERLADRLGQRADRLRRIVADASSWTPDATWDLWHDRAAFHFLLQPAEIEAYVRAAAQAIRPGGRLIVATFAPDGPEKCSGLPVTRYNAPSLADVFAPAFRLLSSQPHLHPTPFGTTQSFVFVVLKRSQAANSL